MLILLDHIAYSFLVYDLPEETLPPDAGYGRQQSSLNKRYDNATVKKID